MQFVFDRFDRVRGGGQGGGEKIFNSKVEEKQETKEFHGGFHDFGREQSGKACESHAAIDQVHRHSAEPNHKRPEETAARALIHDGDINRADRNGDDKPTDQSRDSRRQKSLKMFHSVS